MHDSRDYERRENRHAQEASTNRPSTAGAAVSDHVGLDVTDANLRYFLVETELGHVGADLLAVVLCLVVALAALQLHRLFLAPQYLEGVPALVGALLPLEHGLAVHVVEVQSGRTRCVCLADHMG